MLLVVAAFFLQFQQSSQMRIIKIILSLAQITELRLFGRIFEAQRQWRRRWRPPCFWVLLRPAWFCDYFGSQLGSTDSTGRKHDAGNTKGRLVTSSCNVSFTWNSSFWQIKWKTKTALLSQLICFRFGLPRDTSQLYYCTLSFAIKPTCLQIFQFLDGRVARWHLAIATTSIATI